MNIEKKGFDISVEEDGSFIFINFDKGGRVGGYVSQIGRAHV